MRQHSTSHSQPDQQPAPVDEGWGHMTVWEEGCPPWEDTDRDVRADAVVLVDVPPVVTDEEAHFLVRGERTFIWIVGAMAALGLGVLLVLGLTALGPGSHWGQVGLAVAGGGLIVVAALLAIGSVRRGIALARTAGVSRDSARRLGQRAAQPPR